MNSLIYLSGQDVNALGLTMDEIIDALDLMFVEKGEGRVEMPPKPGIHTMPDAFIHAMPAYIPALEAAGMKWISGYPGNQAKGLPYITGLLVLNDPETGLPIAIMDGAWITARRTGAATAVAAKHLARPESETLGIVACGVQGRNNLEALNCCFDLKKVKAFDLYTPVAEKFARDMDRKFGLEVEVVDTPEKAVRDMDLVVTSGPILQDPEPVIEADWLKPGGFACPLDFDSYWKGQALAQADKLATDDHGQLGYYRTVGYFSETPEPYADLGELAAGKKPGRESDDERTISVNLGLALEDMATAKLIYDKAREAGAGVELPL